MLNDVYNRRILELAGTIPRIGRLESPDASATAHSKLCGSTVTIDLKMDGDIVTDFAHDVKACALGQASSSIMARNVVGVKADELRTLRENMRKMLKENGAPPADGRWADIAVLEPVREYKARHASTMLTFDAVVDAINQIEAKRGATPGKADTGFPSGAEAVPGKVDTGFPSGAATKTEAAPGKVGTGFPSGAATKKMAAE
jgi:NifU-like protein involved in Fe-S cluster formation